LTLRVLFIGDIVGSPGSKIVKQLLRTVRKEKGIDLCVANAENAAGGSGLTPELARSFLKNGVDVITTGDHVWKKRQIIDAMDDGLPVLRPENLPSGSPGSGCRVVRTACGTEVAVILLLGRVFMNPSDSPFQAVDRVLDSLPERIRVRIVDLHAEATSEKVAMGYHLDGRVSAVLGTHTHVTTADEKILEEGTAYITDVGMTGPLNSVLGRTTNRVLYHFTTGLPASFTIAKGPVALNGVLVDVDQRTGLASGIERIHLEMP